MMLARRVISSVLLSVIVFSIIFIFPDWVFCILVSSFIGISLYEFYKIVEKKGVFVYWYFGIVTGMLIPIAEYLQMGMNGSGALGPFFIILACLFTFVLQLSRRDISQSPLTSISVTMLSLLYISWFLSFFINLKLMVHGEALVFYLVLVTKSCDIGAFFIGSYFGKRSLMPHVSPRKTIEGTAGGIAVGVTVSVLSRAYLPEFSLAQLVALGILLSVLGEVGDLAESLLKRECGAKDSGSIIPGIGGILDLIDSLLFTTPLFYFYIKLVGF